MILSEPRSAKILAGETCILTLVEVMQRQPDLDAKKAALTAVRDACIRQVMSLNEAIETTRAEALERLG